MLKSSERLGNSLIERLALDSGKLELERRCSAGAVGASEGAGTPRRAATDLREVRELREGVLVAEGDD